MFYFIAGLLVLASIGFGLYVVIRNRELHSLVTQLQETLRERGQQDVAELRGLKDELAKLEKIRHIPDIIEKAKRTKDEIAARLEQAQNKANEIILEATQEASQLRAKGAARLDQAQKRADDLILSASAEAGSQIRKMTAEAEAALVKAKEAVKVAEWQAANLLEEARKKAKEITSQARKEAKERTQKVEETLDKATGYALEIRRKEEERAKEIGGEAYDALQRHRFFEAAARAMQNAVEGYGDSYIVPAAHILDELAEDYGFHRAGERLKLARERTRLMEKNGTAATCNYPEGWKRDYAINFVLSAFNGKVDSILARVRPANQGRLIQEIKDCYALTNNNGTVFKNARIQEEFLDARLEELKWAVAVQRLKEKEREEQRAIREQIREEERAKKEYERAIRQAQKEEELLDKALEKARRDFEQASGEERAKYEAEIEVLNAKVKEVEEKNQRAISMAQQTKRGHVYIISNVGSSGRTSSRSG
jgi:hypothetical protein